MTLQRETVARAALELVDEVGLDALTTRRLATHLNVQSPALYWHFTNKQELLNCMAEVLVTDTFSDLQPSTDPEREWAAWLADYARRMRRMMLAQRDGARILAEADLMAGSLGTSIDLAAHMLHQAGFGPRGALASVLVLLNYVLGGAFERQAEPTTRPLDGNRRLAAPQSPIFDRKRFPTLARLLDESGLSAISEEWFEDGLRLVLAGMQAALTREAQR